MKKLVAVAAALVLAGNTVFAGDFYNGDIQLQLGVGFDGVTVEDLNSPVSAKLFDFGLETWHLFKPIDMLGVGFELGVNGGIGVTDRWSTTISGFGDSGSLKFQGNLDGTSYNFNFDIGPAVGLYLADVVRLGATFGFSTGFSFDEPYKEMLDSAYAQGSIGASLKSNYVGFNAGAQAKFFPNFFINPVIGWRLVKGFSNSVDYNLGSLKGTLNKKYTFTQNVIYLALAFSW